MHDYPERSSRVCQCSGVREGLGRYGVVVIYEAYRPMPFQQRAVLVLEPPIFFLESFAGGFVKYDVHEVVLDRGEEEREVGDAGCLDVVAFETAIRVIGEFFGVDADLEGDGAFP